VTDDQIYREFQRFDAAGDGSGTAKDQGVQFVYNIYSYRSQLTDVLYQGSVPSTVYHTVQAMDAWGNITQELHGNGVTTLRTHEVERGLVRDVLSTHGLPATQLQSRTYTWDNVGNLVSRREQVFSADRLETFVYDDLNRLTSSAIGGSSRTTTYNGLGNILTKTGVSGTYGYGSGQILRNEEIGGMSVISIEKPTNWFLLCLSFSFGVGCYSSLSYEESFKINMQHNVGLRFDDPGAYIFRYPERVLGQRELGNETREVSYRAGYPSVGVCTVFFLIDAKTGIITSWRSEGEDGACIHIP